MLVSSMNMSPRMEEFFNKYHGKGGRFATALGGGRGVVEHGSPEYKAAHAIWKKAIPFDQRTRKQHRANQTIYNSEDASELNDAYAPDYPMPGRMRTSIPRGRKIKTNLASAKGFMDRVKLKHQTVKHLKTGAITTVGGKKNPNKGSTTNRKP